MVLVVLLSAAPTGGQVRIQPVGSAFDPTTAAVAVSPKRHKLHAVIAEADRDDRDAPLAGDVPALAATVAGLARADVFSGRAQFAPIRRIVARTNPLASSHPARAPPLT